MARVESTMVALGTVAPAFELMDVVSGRAMGRDDVFALVANEDGTAGKQGLLVMFVCVHCPFVKHVEAQLARLGEDYAGRIAMVAISANDAGLSGRWAGRDEGAGRTAGVAVSLSV